MAALYLATALFFSLGKAEAVTVDGAPEWLAPDIVRSLSAVWQEIPPGPERLQTLTLVARRLFTGYGISTKSVGNSPHFVFEARDVAPWRVGLVWPDLRDPVASWFAADAADMEEEIGTLLHGLPLDALTWADSALHEQVEAIVSRHLPGWSFALLVRVEPDDGGSLQISFRPRQPLVLAVTPTILSTTLPVMFQSDLSAKLIPGMSPIIGLPVEWIALHREDVEDLAREFLEERNAVTNTRARVGVAFVPDQVSRLEAEIHSERVIFQLWLAAFAGIDGRYPEAGVWLGWNTKRVTGIDLELYSEMITDLENLSVTTRLGWRAPLRKDFRVGFEVEWPDQEIWYRAWWDSSRIRRPYLWWRWNSGEGHNAGLGYRISEQMSLELYYDDRGEDNIGLRGILQL